jgi:hypothetical protein
MGEAAAGIGKAAGFVPQRGARAAAG